MWDRFSAERLVGEDAAVSPTGRFDAGVSAGAWLDSERKPQARAGFWEDGLGA
jgi:hypothetical protein